MSVPNEGDRALGALERRVEELESEKRALEDQVRRHAEELEARVAERAAELVAAHGRLAREERIAAVGRAAAQVAHEVRNPLAGLLLYSMHLKNKAAGKLSEPELSLVDKIIDTINHLTGTVEQVLSFARPLSLSPRPGDLNRVVADALQLLRPQIEAGRILLLVELDEACGPVVLDEASIRSALTNIVLNAIQAMFGGGTLTVRTKGVGGAAGVEISDTGRGMTGEQLENVFEPFYTTNSQGLGLGMPYARKVIEQHGGSVSIESRAGEGTTVRVTLPGGEEAGAGVTG